MISKEVTYENFDGDEVTEKLWFHISKAEIIADMESQDPDAVIPLMMSFQTQIESGNEVTGLQLLATVKKIIAMAYCERLGDGIKPKTKEASDAFLGSLAFDQLLTELISDPDFALKFITNIFPKDLEALAEKIGKENKGNPKVVKNATVSSIGLGAIPDSESGLAHPRDKDGVLLPWAFRAPTNAEQTRMNKTHLLEVMQRQSKGWTPPAQVTAKLDN